ncbi:MAG: RDD family protein [Firmicutes bacterium]|nr:RDD family protein [Bacillota bacterium]
MIYDLQKASMWKRFSAFLCDFVLAITLAVFFAYLLSIAFSYDTHNEALQEGYNAYAEQFGVDFGISSDEYYSLTDEQLQPYEDAFAAMNEDAELLKEYSTVVNLTLLIATFSLLLALLLLEFLVPLLLKNGQTVGKRIFGLGVMRSDGVRLSTPLLLIRTLLGKYTLETMVPVLAGLTILFNLTGIIGVLFIILIVFGNIICALSTSDHSAFHDLLAKTVVVDLPSQMIFDSPEDLLHYKEEIARDQASRKIY